MCNDDPKYLQKVKDGDPEIWGDPSLLSLEPDHRISGLYGKIYGYVITRFGCDYHIMEDTGQKAAMVILTEIDTLKQPGAFCNWAKRITRHAYVSEDPDRKEWLELKDQIVRFLRSLPYRDDNLKFQIEKCIDSLDEQKLYDQRYQGILLNYCDDMRDKAVSHNLNIGTMEMSQLKDKSISLLVNSNSFTLVLEQWTHIGVVRNMLANISHEPPIRIDDEDQKIQIKEDDGEPDSIDILDPRLQVALDSLSHRARRIFIRRYVEDRTSPEIAAEEELTETNVRQILYKTKKTLREILGEDYLDS